MTPQPKRSRFAFSKRERMRLGSYGLDEKFEEQHLEGKLASNIFEVLQAMGRQASHSRMAAIRGSLTDSELLNVRWIYFLFISKNGKGRTFTRVMIFESLLCTLSKFILSSAIFRRDLEVPTNTSVRRATCETPKCFLRKKELCAIFSVLHFLRSCNPPLACLA